ncbi:MAG: hypothetical protein F6K32_15140 [Desertifilum sp. SIO1I2]|nr:hypothetical protein [Desertifilum sp. SIO1I2]
MTFETVPGYLKQVLRQADSILQGDIDSQPQTASSVLEGLVLHCELRSLITPMHLSVRSCN